MFAERSRRLAYSCRVSGYKTQLTISRYLPSWACGPFDTPHRDTPQQMHYFCFISAQVRGLFSAPLIEILLLHQKLRNADDHRRRIEPKTRPIQAYELL